MFSPVTPNECHCLILLDEIPGHQLRGISQPKKGFDKWIKRMETFTLSRLNPDAYAPTRIRGLRMGVDYALHALIEHSARTRFTFAVADHHAGAFVEWVRHSMTRRTISVLPISEIAEHGLEKAQPDVLLNLYGNCEYTLRLRNELSARTVPTVTLQHGLSRHDYLYSRFFRSLLTRNYSFDSVVCTSDACKTALTKILKHTASTFEEEFHVPLSFQGRLDTIPLCVDTEQLTPASKEVHKKLFRIKPSTMVLLYVGYMSPVKAALGPLLHVFKKLVDTCDKKLRLYIAGTGPDQYAAELRHSVRELKLEHHVVFLREVSDEDKRNLFRAADIFVAPCESLQESFGLTPVEAMSCGVPQVASDWSGYRETIVHGVTGFLVPTKWGQTDRELQFTAELLGWSFDHGHQGQSVVTDLTAMYHSLLSLISNDSLRTEMGRASRERAIDQFSPQTMARRYDELWEELIKESHSRPVTGKHSGFSSPSYFKHFKHFASEELNDNACISNSSSPSLTLDRVIGLSVDASTYLTMLNKELLQLVLSYLNDKAPSEQISIGTVINQFAGSQFSESAVRRHVIVLIKNGLLNLT